MESARTGPSVAEIEQGFKNIQDHICKFLHVRSGERYREDVWDYGKGSGGGITRVWENDVRGGAVLEKAGVNFSGIAGPSLPQSAATLFKIEPGTPFHATGVSLVIHPANPNVPTIHMNIRYFLAGEQWWFGGGIDLTPYYITKAAAARFHRGLKAVCDDHRMDYAGFKTKCDDYFLLPHRGEMRGIGGIFFDHLRTSDTVSQSKDQIWAFIQELGYAFTELYRPFMESEHLARPFVEAQREFQLIRRSRYVEFNLLYDRGTKFGLQSEGRIESILMSMPAVATWRYNWQPASGSFEEFLTGFFLKPQDWVNMAIPANEEWPRYTETFATRTDHTARLAVTVAALAAASVVVAVAYLRRQ